MQSFPESIQKIAAHATHFVAACLVGALLLLTALKETAACISCPGSHSALPI
jgi:hypothetical protein